MVIGSQQFFGKDRTLIIRSAVPADATALSALRVQIDGETEYLDREPGEGFLDADAVRRVIEADSAAGNHLFIVAEAEGSLVGFSRCEGSPLKRLRHQAELGICLLQAYCGCGIGRRMLEAAVAWADESGLHKLLLEVLETNVNAIRLYKRFGFEQEGILRDDKRLSDGRYYNTIMMGRIRPQCPVDALTGGVFV